MEELLMLCTEEQTRRALKLGAPLIRTRLFVGENTIIFNKKRYFIPSSEYLCSWFRQIGLDCCAEILKSHHKIVGYRSCVYDLLTSKLVSAPMRTNCAMNKYYNAFNAHFVAIQKAIDMALDYLEGKEMMK